MTAVARPRIWTTDAGVIAEERRSETLAAVTRDHVAPCTVRAGKPDDLAFVCDSWVKHAHRGERKREATRHVRALISRARSFLSVAHVPGEPDAILGWAVVEDGEPAVVHYVYCRASGRQQGVASALLGRLAQERMEYSHTAPAGIAVPRLWTLNIGRAVTE